MIERRRVLRRGELLAISETDVQKDDRGAFFFLFGPPIYENERVGSAIVVRICGPLDYHADGMGESYEGIVCRLRDAFAGIVCGEQGEKPSCVIMRIDSPGGVVAGLHETVKCIRKMRQAANIPLITYVDETAYSAGFALSCAADEIYLPKSGFCGSIGVISTLVDQTEADKKAGLRFVILTSGARKADGHVHAPITDEMIAEETPRVEELASQFFQDVSKARGLSVETIQAFEAKRFLGAEAVEAGVADGVMGWDKLIETVEEAYGGGETQSRLDIGQSSRAVANSGHVDAQRANRANRKGAQVRKGPRQNAGSRRPA